MATRAMLSLAAAGLALTACGGGGGSGQPSGGPTAPPAAPVSITEAQNGQTVNVAKGDLVVVLLSSTYWMISSPADAKILKPNAAPTVAPSPDGCVPGQGCGTVEQDYTAVGDGKTVIAASRTTCGEALLCTGNQGKFSVTIVVSG